MAIDIAPFDLGAATYDVTEVPPLYVQDPLSPNLVYWNPLSSIYAADPTEGQVIFDYWCRTCPSLGQPSLLNIDAFNIDNPPTFPSFTAGCILEFGQCYIAQQWAYSSFWQKITSGVENTEGYSCDA